MVLLNSLPLAKDDLRVELRKVTGFLSTLVESLFPELGEDQRRALRLLSEGGNVFVTGGAGTGKSHLLKRFLEGVDKEKFPVLASTGAAAVLLGGRTFHSFFGLGIMEGGRDATIERALKNPRARRRLRKAEGVVIDEVSMLSGATLDVAEAIARLMRDSNEPWGGLRVVAVGDFAQLPPVTRSGPRDWAFLHPVWARTQFQPAVLREMMRAKDPEFCALLSKIRFGVLDPEVESFLEGRTVEYADEQDAPGTMLFARREDVDRLNHERLRQLPGTSRRYATVYLGQEAKARESVKKNAPVPEQLELKEGALVMLRQNDPQGRWVNGSLGVLQGLEDDTLEIRLLSGRTVRVEPASFQLLDAEGKELAAARNFPVNLAWAMTIHKAQGATIDRARVSLARLWEPGQAYVALSRVRRAQDVELAGWDRGSILADPAVRRFHASLEG